MVEHNDSYPKLIRHFTTVGQLGTPEADDQLSLWGCPKHGIKFKRDSCAPCNAAYMRKYLRDRRLSDPVWDILYRAQKRAAKQRLPFTIGAQGITLPPTCPVLGTRLVIGGPRSAASPSLDRINPNLGYVQGNVRIISDRANCLKGSADLTRLRYLADHGRLALRADYSAIVRYLERELLLRAVGQRAERDGPCRPDWMKIERFLEVAFRNGICAAGGE